MSNLHMNQVVRLTGLLMSLAILGQSRAVESEANEYFVEAESFAKLGGWSLDTQFIQEMGSPYLLAHGLGTPVADAVTEINVEQRKSVLGCSRGNRVWLGEDRQVDQSTGCTPRGQSVDYFRNLELDGRRTSLGSYYH